MKKYGSLKRCWAVFLLLAIALVLSGCAVEEVKEQQGLSAEANQVSGPQETTEQNGTADENGTDSEGQITAEETTTFEEQIANCKAKENIIERDSCIKSVSISEQRENGCLELNVLGKEECLSEIAIGKSDEDICTLIDPEKEKWNCLEEIAVSKKEYEICEEIGADENIMRKDECLIAVAVSAGDYDICKQVSVNVRENSFMRDQCYENFEIVDSNLDFCERYISQTKEADCIRNISSDSNSSSEQACFGLSDEELDECIYRTATENSIYLDCYLLKDDTNVQNCIDYIAENSPDINVCSVASRGLIQRECYKEVGIEDNNAEICEIIATSDERDDCFYNIAIDLNDSSLCKKIFETKFLKKDECFETIALEKKDVTVCEELYFEENYLNCYVEIAKLVEESNICSLMQLGHFRQYSIYTPESLCYKEYAIETNNTDVCIQINNTELKQECNDLNAVFH